MRTCLAVLVLIVWMASLAHADIIEWQDASGVHHYTNLEGEVPQDTHAQVVVDESIRHIAPAPDAGNAAPPAADGAPASKSADDPEQVANAYRDGIERGLDLARQSTGGASLQVNGPLAVASASVVAPPQYVPPAYEPPIYAPLYNPYVNPFVPGVLVVGNRPFERLRRLDHHRFAGAEPFAFHGPVIPMSVAINPLMPSRRFDGRPAGW